MFDTLTYANKLKEAGFTERQAQAQAEALVAVVDSNLATRHDLKELEIKLDSRLKELEMSTKRDLKELELRFEGRFLLVNWMLGFVLAGILSLVVKTFFSH